MRDEVFAELTYHAAYEPQRAVRNKRCKYIRRYGDGGPVLPNIDDGPSKDLLMRPAGRERQVDREQLYDLVLDPNEMSNLVGEPALRRCAGRAARAARPLDARDRATRCSTATSRLRPAR